MDGGAVCLTLFCPASSSPLSASLPRSLPLVHFLSFLSFLSFYLPASLPRSRRAAMALITFFTWILALLLSVAVSAPTSSGPQHIFLLAGQSNMVGHGGLSGPTNGQHWDGKVPPQCLPHPGVFRLNADSTWSPAKEPIHGGIFPGMPVTGIGPGMPFARRVLELHPTFGTVGLVPCAYDWTGIKEWSRSYVPPPGYTRQTLYKNLIERADASVRAGGQIAALLWWQGGKDATNKTEAELYKKRLENFFKDVRADLGRPDLLILMIIIPEGEAQFAGIVRDAQNSTELQNLLKIEPPPALPYEADKMHINSTGQVTIGTLVAEKYCGAGYCKASVHD